MIENARKIASEKGFSNVEFLYGDAENIDFPDDYFDLVLCNSSLHFFPDKLKALREMCRVLKPGGQWAFTYAGKPSWQEVMKIAHMVEARHPELKSLYTAIHDTEDWALEYEESMDLLEKAGLKISNVYERRGVDYANPDIIVSESCSAWKYWKQETPEQMVDTIKRISINLVFFYQVCFTPKLGTAKPQAHA